MWYACVEGSVGQWAMWEGMNHVAIRSRLIVQCATRTNSVLFSRALLCRENVNRIIFLIFTK